MALLRRWLALAPLAVLLAVPAAAAAPPVSEYDVKAAFLYNFAKFVEWPPDAFPDTSSLKICVLDEDPFGKSLQAVTDEQVGEHKLIVTRTESLAKPAGCQILFISRSEKERVRQILSAVKDAPVLTVGDTQGFADDGVIINFVLEGSKVRFEINMKSADQARIKISSKLLQLAKKIVPNPGARPGP
ncbi:MAG: YfiR family protein [Thermoanaerobaculia bacterium]